MDSSSNNINVGDKFANWQVVDITPKGGLVCLCTLCNTTEKILKRHVLVHQRSKSCGCQKNADAKKYKIQVGEVLGFWKVLDTKGRKFLCECTNCAKTRRVDYVALLNGKSRSCGCLKKQFLTEASQIKYGTDHPHQSSTIKEKKKKTNLEKFGVEYPSQSLEVQEKTKQTNLDKYGVLHPHQAEVIKEKKKQTNLQKLGVEYPRQSPEIQDKIKQTNLDRYGTPYPTQLPEIQLKMKQTNLEKYGVDNYSKTPEKRYQLKEWCEANPGFNGTSYAEQEILTWIQTFYPNAHKYKTEGNELDIYIPEIKVGIEHNGFYWHSELHKSNNYHLNKTKFFKEKDIRVIHIFEHEWRDRQEQVKSFIQSAINKNKFKIGARKCRFIWTDLKKDKREVAEFLDTYHIQGRCNFSHAVKVIYSNQLIGVATFGRHHRNSTDWVLSRFCTKQNYTIQGGLAKISKLAYSNLNSPLISWAHYRISDGNGYLKAGWKYEELLRPDYFYFKGTTVIGKQSRQKKFVGTPKGMTEKQHAKLDGLERIWDCGKIRFRYEGD